MLHGYYYFLVKNKDANSAALQYYSSVQYCYYFNQLLYYIVPYKPSHYTATYLFYARPSFYPLDPDNYSSSMPHPVRILIVLWQSQD